MEADLGRSAAVVMAGIDSIANGTMTVLARPRFQQLFENFLNECDIGILHGIPGILLRKVVECETTSECMFLLSLLHKLLEFPEVTNEFIWTEQDGRLVYDIISALAFGPNDIVRGSPIVKKSADRMIDNLVATYESSAADHSTLRLLYNIIHDRRVTVESLEPVWRIFNFEQSIHYDDRFAPLANIACAIILTSPSHARSFVEHVDVTLIPPLLDVSNSSGAVAVMRLLLCLFQSPFSSRLDGLAWTSVFDAVKMFGVKGGDVDVVTTAIGLFAAVPDEVKCAAAFADVGSLYRSFIRYFENESQNWSFETKSGAFSFICGVARAALGYALVIESLLTVVIELPFVSDENALEYINVLCVVTDAVMRKEDIGDELLSHFASKFVVWLLTDEHRHFMDESTGLVDHIVFVDGDDYAMSKGVVISLCSRTFHVHRIEQIG